MYIYIYIYIYMTASHLLCIMILVKEGTQILITENILVTSFFWLKHRSRDARSSAPVLHKILDGKIGHKFWSDFWICFTVTMSATRLGITGADTGVLTCPSGEYWRTQLFDARRMVVIAMCALLSLHLGFMHSELSQDIHFSCRSWSLYEVNVAFWLVLRIETM